MSKIWPLISLLLVVIFFIFFKQNQNQNINHFNYLNNYSGESKIPTATKTTTLLKSQRQTEAIFIPYWSINQDFSDLKKYDRLIYFGISVNPEGIDRNEQGYLKLKDFGTKSFPQEKILTLRMIESETNFIILKNVKIQEEIIKETVDIVKKYKFSGVALDLELFSIFNSEIKGQINNFVQQFYSKLKAENLKFIFILYGDSLYRKRPFDIKSISDSCDEIMVMAYDFSKSYGTPGPNFPYEGEEPASAEAPAGRRYGYDFKTMVDDMLNFIPKDKLNIIFGMFGYDWQVDEKKRPIKPAEALTLNQIKKKFLEKCLWDDCVVKRDELSKETEINYIIPEIKDDFAYMYYHVVWFEDEKSVEIKKEFLKEKGIGSVAYWAWGYF